MPVTNFPNPGDDKSVSLANSKWDVFPVGEALELKRDYPEIWGKGGNIRGNSQFAILSPMAKERRGPKTDREVDAIKLREAWVARHKGDFRLAGVVAQIKWLAIGERGINHMREVIKEAKEKIDSEKAFTYKVNSSIVSAGDNKASFVISTESLDRQNEIVDQEGWDFNNYMKNPVVLDTHRCESINDVVGKVVGMPRRTNSGWVVDIEFANTEKGQLAKELVDNRFINAVSVGFRSLTRRPEGKVTRHTKMELLEVSLVAIPANPEALRVKAVQPNRDLPLAPEDYAWDQPAAQERVRKWASSDDSGDKDKIDWEKYARAFMLVREGLEEDFGGYGYPYADVIDGRLYAHIRPIQIIANILAGGQGGGKLDSDERRKMARVVASYYEKAGLELPPSLEDLVKGYEDKPMNKPMDDKEPKPRRKDVGMLMELRDILLDAVSRVEDIVSYYEGEDEAVAEDEGNMYKPDMYKPKEEAPEMEPQKSVDSNIADTLRGLIAAFDRRIN